MQNRNPKKFSAKTTFLSIILFNETKFGLDLDKSSNQISFSEISKANTGKSTDNCLMS